MPESFSLYKLAYGPKLRDSCKLVKIKNIFQFPKKCGLCFVHTIFCEVDNKKLSQYLAMKLKVWKRLREQDFYWKSLYL